MANAMAVLLVSGLSASAQYPCEETGPHWGDWVLGSCPALNNTPSVSPNSYACIPIGNAPPVPTVTVPTYSTGSKSRTGTYDCTNTVAGPENADITFTVSAVQWDPALPATFTSQHLNGHTFAPFTSTAYVTVTSDAQDLCAAPGTAGRVDIGSCTWVVSDYALRANASPQVDYLPEWGTFLANLTAGYYDVGSVSLGSQITLSADNTWCCDGTPNGSPAQALSTVVRYTAGNATVTLTAGGLNILPGLLNKILAALNAVNNTALGTGINTALPGGSLGTLNASGTANFREVTYSDNCLCANRPTTTAAWYGNHGVTASGILGNFTIPASVMLLADLNHPLDIQALVGNFSYMQTGSDPTSIPDPLNTEHIVSITQSSSLKTTLTCGPDIFPPIIWISNTPAPVSTTNIICRGNYYP